MKRYLIDTYILFWAIFEPEKLNQSEAKIIDGASNLIYVSAASLWELAIKKTIGKLTFPDNFFDAVEDNGYDILNISTEHIKHSTALPLLHRDPFDRLLVAQIMAEKLSLITRDENMKAYFK